MAYLYEEDMGRRWSRIKIDITNNVENIVTIEGASYDL